MSDNIHVCTKHQKLKLQLQRILTALTNYPQTIEQLEEADQKLFNAVVVAKFKFTPPPPEDGPGVKSNFLRFWLAADALLKSNTALVQWLDVDFSRIEELASKRPPKPA